MRTLNKQNLEDIVVGCSFLGTGGGGSMPHGMKRIYDDLEAGLVFKLMSPQEMNDDDYAAAPYGVGSTAPPTEAEKEKYAKLPHIKEEPTAVAFRLLEKYLNLNPFDPAAVKDSMQVFEQKLDELEKLYRQ